MENVRFVHMPLRVVDIAVVAADRLGAMLSLLEEEIVPVMIAAGAKLGSCLATSPEIGEDVIIETTWLVEDHAAWNVIRANCFLDPRWHAMWAKARTLRCGSDRRFFYPTGIATVGSGEDA